MTALRTGRHACGIVAARRVLSLALHPGTREAQFSDAVFEEAGEGGSGSITMAPGRKCVPPVNRATPASSFSS